MANGFAPRFSRSILTILFTLSLTVLSLGCAQDDDSKKRTVVEPAQLDINALENPELKNCAFTNPKPEYVSGSAIEPNPIACFEGVAKRVELLSPNPLPDGIRFSMEQLALVGTPTQKVDATPYEFYLENEAGYLRIQINLTVR